MSFFNVSGQPVSKEKYISDVKEDALELYKARNSEDCERRPLVLAFLPKIIAENGHSLEVLLNRIQTSLNRKITILTRESTKNEIKAETQLFLNAFHQAVETKHEKAALRILSIAKKSNVLNNLLKYEEPLFFHGFFKAAELGQKEVVEELLQVLKNHILDTRAYDQKKPFYILDVLPKIEDSEIKDLIWSELKKHSSSDEIQTILDKIDLELCK